MHTTATCLCSFREESTDVIVVVQADCHAFDGSAMLKMLNETNTATAAGEILASSQERNAGYGLVSLMALMSMIMF